KRGVYEGRAVDRNVVHFGAGYREQRKDRCYPGHENGAPHCGFAGLLGFFWVADIGPKPVRVVRIVHGYSLFRQSSEGERGGGIERRDRCFVGLTLGERPVGIRGEISVECRHWRTLERIVLESRTRKFGGECGVSGFARVCESPGEGWGVKADQGGSGSGAG